MSENYIVINGKKAELTEDQLAMLGLDAGAKRANPFERVAKGGVYFFVDLFGYVSSCPEVGDRADADLFDHCNYFNDKALATQVALHQLLYRKLLKFACDNGFEDSSEWDGANTHWTIRYYSDGGGFSAYSQECYKAQDIYFSSKEGAERAIKEVVKPFVRENPKFVW